LRDRPFKFRMQKVLDYRTHIEDRLKAELAELRVWRERLVAFRAQLLGLVEHCIDRLAEGEFNVLDIQLTTLYMGRLEREIAGADEQIAELDERIERKLAEVVEASRNRKVMEMLKERAFDDYRAALLRAEQKFLDELGTNAFQRSAGGRRRAGRMSRGLSP